MKKVDLIVVPSQNFDWSVLSVDAPTFGDNGGEPDGAGPYLRDARDFEDIGAAIIAGAELSPGFEVPYQLEDYEVAQNSGKEFCGYQAEKVAYCLDENTAIFLESLQSRGSIW